MSTEYMFSPCATNGPWFRYTSDGHIEVQDIGIPKFESLPKRLNQWKDLIDQNAARWQIPPSVIAAFMSQESAGYENAVSISNAYGLMQMILSTAKNWGNKYLNRNNITVQDLFVPEINIAIASAGLSSLMRKYDNNIVKVAAEYNSGRNRCGVSCSTDKKTGEKHCCQTSKWGLATNCGYIDGIIRFNNTAIDYGYSGIPILMPKSSGWTALVFLASAAIGGTIVVFGAKKGLY